MVENVWVGSGSLKSEIGFGISASTRHSSGFSIAASSAMGKAGLGALSSVHSPLIAPRGAVSSQDAGPTLTMTEDIS